MNKRRLGAQISERNQKLSVPKNRVILISKSAYLVMDQRCRRVGAGNGNWWKQSSANRRHLTGNRANNARPRLLLSPALASVVGRDKYCHIHGRGERGETNTTSRFELGGPRPID